MLKINTFRPDTCNCILGINIDDQASIDDITPSLSEIIFKCSIHSDEDTDNDVFQAIVVENRRKNLVWRNLLDNALSDMIETGEDGIIRFKSNIIITWSWSGVKPMRTLTIRLLGKILTTNQKNIVQNRLDNAFPNQNIVFVNN